MNEMCECEMAGYCSRHNMTKGQARFNLCKGLGNPKDCGLSYWQAWEKGELGATAPSNPNFNPKGFCNNEQLPVPPIEIKSSIGTRLHDIIHRETGENIPCQECANRISMLNQMTKKQVIEARESIVDDIYQRSSKVAPKLWQKISIAVDSALSTGIVRSKITKWVDEAIDDEPDYVIEEKIVNDVKKKSCKACGK